MNPIILGAGLAGLTLAYFLKAKLTIIEKEKKIGGLCRSFKFRDIYHDIGPHILFSKNEKITGFIESILDTNKFKRSNKIFYKGRFVKYPFENELSALPEDDRKYCLEEFLNNPYQSYRPTNMLQNFLAIFGEGITKLYLQPYNEKIWKFDLSFMDLQLTERIPQPPREDVIKSASGRPTEGYLHQLYFRYPKEGGIQSLPNTIAGKIKKLTDIKTGVKINSITKNNNQWIVNTDNGEFKTNLLINCMPLHELFNYLKEIPDLVRDALNFLKYNSIHIVTLRVKKDRIGNNFALYIPRRDIIFHRLSKINFFGPNYTPPDNCSTLIAEVTYRQGSYTSNLKTNEIEKKVTNGLDSLDLVKEEDVIDIETKSFKYAYVIYDLAHRKNIDIILGYLKSINIYCCGRFAEFEYLNMDSIISRAEKMSTIIKDKINE